MADRPYSVSINHPRGYIAASVNGFMNLSQCDAFIAQIRSAANEIEASGAQVRVLVDTRDHGVQSSEVVDRLRQFACETIHFRSAVITDGALARMQVSRVTASQSHRIFSDPDEALAWLLS